jgi:metal-responsive CopG/Arc/MetJ family transcriptional regulator
VCNQSRRTSVLSEEFAMAKLVRIVIQLPMDLKVRLDGLKQQGYTTSGFIRAMLERELAKIDQASDDKSLTLLPSVKRANSR